MSYFEKFENISSVTRKICIIIGAYVLDKDFKVNYRTICLIVTTMGGISGFLYKTYLKIIGDGDYSAVFITGAVIGTALQGLAKANAALGRGEQYRLIYSQIKETYEEYGTNAPLRYTAILEYNLSLIRKLLAGVFGIVSFLSFGVTGIWIILLVFFDTRLEILPNTVPYLDYETTVGYYTTSAIHIALIFLSGYGNFGFDTYVFMFVAHVPLMKNILKLKFDDLAEVVEEHPRDITKSYGPLLEIFKWHQKYKTLCLTLKSSLFWVVFIQIVTLFFGIASNIVCIFLDIWLPAPVVGLYLFATICSYCVLGNLVEMSNDEITTMIYDFCWYNLTVPEQKLILIMLRESQNATGLSIGGVAPLTLNTAVQMSKTIYTLSMMLKEFFD